MHAQPGGAIRGWLLIALIIGLVIGALSTPVASASIRSAEPAPPTTLNEFVPADRDLSDCVGALQKPGCGSDARGGWRQTTVLIAVLLGLGVIAGRIILASRRTAQRNANRSPQNATTPDTT